MRLSLNAQYNKILPLLTTHTNTLHSFTKNPKNVGFFSGRLIVL